MADENVIEFPIRVPGAQEAAQAMGGVAAALKTTQTALDNTSKGAKSASDSIGALNTSSKTASKDQDALAKSANQATEALAREREAAAKLVSTTLSPLTAEQDKLNKSIRILTTELGRLQSERQKALSENTAQGKGLDNQIANTQAALAKLRDNRVAISQATLAGAGALGGPAGVAPGQAIGAMAVETERAAGGHNTLALAAARSAAALNIVGGELAQVNPEMATMVQAVGRSSGVISGFTGLLNGAGGLGTTAIMGGALAAGGLIAALGTWINYTRRETEEQEALATSIEKTNKALDEQVKSASAIAYKGSASTIGAELATKRGALSDLKNQRLAIAGGGYQGNAWTDMLPGSDEAKAATQKAADEAAKANMMTAERQRSIETMERAIADLEKQQEAAELAERDAASKAEFWAKMQKDASLGGPGATPANQKAAAAAKSYLATHNEDGSLIETGDGTTRAGRIEYRRETAVGTALGEQSETIKRQLAAAQEFQKQQQQLYQQGAAAQREVQARAVDDEFAQQRRIADFRKLGIADEIAENDAKLREMAARDKVSFANEVAMHRDKEAQIISLAEYRQSQEAKHDAARKQAVAEYSQLGVRGYQTLGAMGIQTIQALAKGQHITGKMILASIGDAMVAEGTRTLFQGLAMSANPLTPGAGAGMIGIGTAEIAAGIGIGAATSGGASAGAGGGGGGYGPSNGVSPGAVYWDGTKYVRGAPTSPVLPGSTGNAPVNVYQSLTYQSMTPPSDEDWRRFKSHADEAARRSVIPHWGKAG